MTNGDPFEMSLFVRHMLERTRKYYILMKSMRHSYAFRLSCHARMSARSRAHTHVVCCTRRWADAQRGKVEVLDA